MSPDRYLTPRQLSEMLSIPAKTLEMWRWRGVGPKFHKFGKLVRYKETDVQAWIKANAKGAAA
jgi:excisionase family DNA binding protein